MPRHYNPAPSEMNLEKALNQVISSIGSRQDPIDRALASARVGALVSQGLSQIQESRSRAVAEAVVLPGMSMAKVAAELGISKSMVAKLAGPSDFRQQLAADMRARLYGGLNLPPPRP